MGLTNETNYFHEKLSHGFIGGNVTISAICSVFLDLRRFGAEKILLSQKSDILNSRTVLSRKVVTCTFL